MTPFQPATWKRFAPDWRTLFSAILIVVSFPPWNLWPLIWIALIPWFIALDRAKTPRAALIQGFWLSYFMSLGGFYWIAYVLHEFAGAPWAIGVLALQAFALIGQPQFMVFALIWKHFSKQRSTWNPLVMALLFAFAYTGLDWILPKMFMDTLGHSFYKARYVRQLADVGGPALLTFLLYLVNESLWTMLQKALPIKKLRFVPEVGLAAVLCVLGTLYGWYRYEDVQRKVSQSSRGLQIAAIQGNIGDFDKLAAENGVRGAANKVIQTFLTLSEQALQLTPKPQAIIWPETSFPSTFRSPHSSTEAKLDEEVESFSRKIGIPLLFGGYDRIGYKDYNAFFFLTPPGQLQVYRKNILLIFGEYIPGADSMMWIRETFPQVGNFGRGVGPQVLSIESKDSPGKPIQAGPIICYEALFPNYVIEAARKGSELILNITNDSWFGEWGEPQLHLALTTFRSIETHLPMVRSTNTGISALITADGEITSPTGIGTREIMNVHVPFTPPIPTLMKLWGDWFGPFALILGLLGFGLISRKSLRRAGRKR